MNTRWYERRDLEALRQIHALMGFEYELPDPQNKNVVARFVTVADGQPVAAVIGRRTAEAYFLLRPGWGTPQERYAAFLELHNRALDVGRMLGLEDVQVFLPPQVEKPFRRRLFTLGWAMNEWHCYCRDL